MKARDVKNILHPIQVFFCIFATKLFLFYIFEWLWMSFFFTRNSYLFNLAKIFMFFSLPEICENIEDKHRLICVGPIMCLTAVSVCLLLANNTGNTISAPANMGKRGRYENGSFMWKFPAPSSCYLVFSICY